MLGMGKGGRGLECGRGTNWAISGMTRRDTGDPCLGERFDPGRGGPEDSLW